MLFKETITLREKILKAFQNVKELEKMTGLTYPLDTIHKLIEEEIDEKIWSK